MAALLVSTLAIDAADARGRIGSHRYDYWLEATTDREDIGDLKVPDADVSSRSPAEPRSFRCPAGA